MSFQPTGARPINLGGASMQVGLGGRFRMPAMPPQMRPQATPAPDAARDTQREARAYGVAEALSQPIEIGSGSWAEALAEGLAGGLRGRAAQNMYAAELERNQAQTQREARSQGLEDQYRQAQIKALQAETAQAGTPEWEVIPQDQLPPGARYGERNRRTGRGEMEWTPQPPASMSFPIPGMPVQGAAGYVWGPNGTQMPAPGGPADRQINQAQAQRARAALSRIEDQANVTAAIDRAIQLAGSGETGAIGAAMRNVPGTRAFDLDAQLDIIRANIGFDALMEMRANSPTGGALGAVTERELALLQSTLESLNQAQSREQFLDGLNRLRSTYAGSMQRIRAAYEEDFGGQAMDYGAPAAAAQGGGNVIRYDANGNRIP